MLITMNKIILFGLRGILLIVYLPCKIIDNWGMYHSKTRMDGKVVIITGANYGIGFEVVLDLAQRGAQVVLTCETKQKVDQINEKISLESIYNVTGMLLDLASFASIREFVEEFKAKYDRLDVLINNDGYMTEKRETTKEGFELQFGTMQLGYFMLTGLLIDMLKTSAPSRIINVSSDVHKGVDIDWDDMQSEKNYNGLTTFRRCKLANCLFTLKLAEKFKMDGITSVSVNPGEVFEIAPDHGNPNWLWTILKAIYYLPSFLLKNNKHAAQTHIYCAVDHSIPRHNGKYFSDMRVASSSPESTNKTSARRLWEISKELTGIDF